MDDMLYVVDKKNLEPDPDFVKLLDSAIALLPDDALAAMRAGCKFDVFMDGDNLVFKSQHLISILKDPKDGHIISIIERRKQQ